MDLENYVRFIFALIFVLGLIGVLSLVVRRYGLGMATAKIRKGQDRRISLVEILPLDAKRRAVLIRRDTVEHLVILGPDSETVVECGIAPPPDEPNAAAQTPPRAIDKFTDKGAS